jgi:meso-butanediol dehydrogenase/(S,S)-butanediol dehydrogenase/diacetyl reductase
VTRHAGRVAVVTGAAAGIGRATVEKLLADGAAGVVAVDVNREALRWTDGVERVASLAGDLTDPAVNAEMVALAVSRFGALHAVALNAGIVVQGTIQRGSMEDFDRTIDINVRAVVLGIKAALPELEKADGGAVVVTGSVSGLAGDSGLWAYNASKAAVVNVVRSVALDIGHLGIRINSVCPGPVNTAMTANVSGMPMETAMKARIPLQRFAEPSEIANVIAFLASPEASFMTGAEVPVDGGVTCGTGQWATTGGRRSGFL